MRIEKIHHVSLLVADLERALQFYCGLLQLPLLPERPVMSFSGAWLDAGAGQQIHLLQLPAVDAGLARPEHGGRDRHVAFSVVGLEDVQTRLQQQGIVFTRSQSGRAALFCRDPDGNALEFIEVL